MSQVVLTIKEKPDDIYGLFNAFADILIKQTLWIKDTRMDIREIGSRDKLSSNFRLMMSAGAELNFTLTFDISNDWINILYEDRIKFYDGYMPYKMTIKKLVKKTVTPQMISLIKNSLNEANKEMKDEIDSHPRDTLIINKGYKFCTKCGYQNPKNSSFCIDCGNKF